jgi:hypothetical protein
MQAMIMLGSLGCSAAGYWTELDQARLGARCDHRQTAYLETCIVRNILANSGEMSTLRLVMDSWLSTPSTRNNDKSVEIAPLDLLKARQNMKVRNVISFTTIFLQHGQKGARTSPSTKPGSHRIVTKEREHD